MILLSICIPYLPEPKSLDHLAALRLMIDPQMTDEVELVFDDRPRNIPTGTKRNDMYAKAQGQYVCSVDCDDWIATDYVEQIITAIKSGSPDVVTFCGWYTENGRNHLDWTIKLGEKYEARHEDGKYQIFRWPNHLAVMKKELATRVKFRDVWHGEDYQWSEQIMKQRLLQTEVHIPKQLYHYIYLTGK